jgi:hypothetical protein
MADDAPKEIVADLVAKVAGEEQQNSAEDIFQPASDIIRVNIGSPPPRIVSPSDIDDLRRLITNVDNNVNELRREVRQFEGTNRQRMEEIRKSLKLFHF